MKLPQLIKTKHQLRKVLRKGDIESKASFDRLGPCPEFIQGAATELCVQGVSYIVFMSLSALEKFRLELQKQDDARRKGTQ